jgi:hypothetical protein
VNHRVLWLSVLNQTIQDAEGKIYDLFVAEIPDAQRKAQKWLLYNDKDYLEVCSLAGLTPEQTKLLRERMTERYAK